MRAILIVSFLLAAACATPPPPEPEPEEVVKSDEIVGEPVAVAYQFSHDQRTGCVATGDTGQIRGVIQIEPFGKGTEGVVLDDGEVTWVVSYNAEDSVFEQFDKIEVLAMGRVCDKRGEAVMLPHFIVRSLRPITSADDR